MGPTASGKTALSLTIAKEYPVEIISVDSAMIYCDMDIGSAKPSPEEMAVCPHHLIDIRTPEESYSAADFCADALRLMAEIHQRGNTPLLVGGTMMYFRALQQGLSDLPKSAPEIRAGLQARLLCDGLPSLYQALCDCDPIMATRLHPNDTQRIMRALEVFEQTGLPMSLQQTGGSPQGDGWQYHNLALFPKNRAWLHQRIAVRFHLMLEQGFLDEVRGLQKKYAWSLDCPSARSVGYRQALEHLAGLLSYEEFIERGIVETRQLAKRQLTWLRSWSEVSYLEPQDPDLHEQGLAVIAKISDNRNNKFSGENGDD